MKMRLLFAHASVLITCGVTALHAQPELPSFGAASFGQSTTINNQFLPLVPNTIATFNEVEIDPETGEASKATIIVEVLPETRVVAGIEARVVRDRVFQDGLVREDTFDWYAQDDQGNVWYLGEEVTDFDYDDQGRLVGTRHPGMWESGKNGALPGYIMPASPQLNSHYYQEYYPEVAEDDAMITGLNQSFVVPAGSFSNVLRTRDATALEPDKYANKYYAPGVGLIAERSFDAEDNTVLTRVDRNPTSILPTFDPGNFEQGISINNPYFPVVAGRIVNYQGREFDSETGDSIELGYQEILTSGTREIMGIKTQIVRGFEIHDGLLNEDSEFYYAQDKNGNVWWMGEFSTKFEYDEEGNFIRTYDDSTWIAGVNGAKPGYYMPADRAIGASFYEIFSPADGDIDTMKITSTDATVTTVLGELSNVAVVSEHSDFSVDFYANKYYAPGVGLVQVNEDFDDLGNPRVVLKLTRAFSGDFDGNGQLDVVDLELLSSAVRSDQHPIQFDMDGDLKVNQFDRQLWVQAVRQTYFGDSNFDGEFDSTDLVNVFASGTYEDEAPRNSNWATGDWNGDQEFDSSDVVLAFQFQGYETGPRPAVASVPEPTSAIPMIMPMAIWVASRLRKK